VKRLLWAGLVAVALCAQARAGSSDDFKQGVTALRHGDRNGAIVALSRALSAHDLATNLRPVALLDRAFAHAANRQTAPAISDLTEAIRLKPDYIAAFGLRARMYAASGDSRAAAADCHRIVASNAKDPAIFGFCGYLQALCAGRALAGAGEAASGQTEPGRVFAADSGVETEKLACPHF
jgi:hypothetical protein